MIADVKRKSNFDQGQFDRVKKERDGSKNKLDAAEKNVDEIRAKMSKGDPEAEKDANELKKINTQLSQIENSETFEVQMLNQGTDGVMVFEPSTLQIAVGDTVTFKPSNPGHNSASIAGMIPDGAESWDSGMSQEITITFTEEGTYVYQCTPHLMMAMVGVITVGNPETNLNSVKEVAVETKASFMMAQDRLDGYLEGL